MRKIEEGLHRVHALAGASDAEQLMSDIPDSQETEALEPFLRVNLVSPGSPAETAVRPHSCNLTIHKLVKSACYNTFV